MTKDYVAARGTHQGLKYLYIIRHIEEKPYLTWYIEKPEEGDHEAEMIGLLNLDNVEGATEDDEKTTWLGWSDTYYLYEGIFPTVERVVGEIKERIDEMLKEE